MRPREDSGVTLVEVLVCLSVAGLLAAVIANAIGVGYRTTDTTIARLSGSQGAQIAAAFFPSDIQSAATITRATAACGGATPTAAISWTDVDALNVSVSKQAQYALRIVGTEQQLVRRYYEGCALISTLVVVHNASSATVTCSPDPTCAAPISATLTATEVGGFSFSLTGRRRMT